MLVSAPDRIATARLLLRVPAAEDAEAIFAYASDVESTRYMSWPRHRALDDTRAFLELAERGWRDDAVGAYLIERDGAVIGSTGLHPHAAQLAETGYILARAAWGHGYATEACRAMIDLGARLGFVRVEAQCHASHLPSARVLEKAGMRFEGVLRRRGLFPNLSSSREDVRSYAWT
jgi:ribosomal-protein-alanine N-acetyltransferase